VVLLDLHFFTFCMHQIKALGSHIGILKQSVVSHLFDFDF